MASVNTEGKPIYTLGDPGQTYLAEDLVMVKQPAGWYSIRLKSDGQEVGNSTIPLAHIEVAPEEGAS